MTREFHSFAQRIGRDAATVACKKTQREAAATATTAQPSTPGRHWAGLGGDPGRRERGVNDRVISKPRPGYFKVRMGHTKSRRVIWGPARIERPIPLDPETGEMLDRHTALIATIDGVEVAMDRVWLSAFEIDKAEYDYVRADLDWWKKYEPGWLTFAKYNNTESDTKRDDMDQENQTDDQQVAIAERETPPALVARGLTLEQWRVLKDAIWPAAKSNEAIFMAIDYCKARGLDPFKRIVHIVPVWDAEKKCLVETVWPGIAELRTTAARTGQYAGKDEPVFGETVEARIGDVQINFPEWCQVTVWRLIAGQRVAFHGSRVYWEEAYATKGRSDEPNTMWRKRPRGQLAKCAEAEALREAFPEEIGGDYSVEEMQGQTIGLEPPPPRPERSEFTDDPTEPAPVEAEPKKPDGDAPAEAKPEPEPVEAKADPLETMPALDRKAEPSEPADDAMYAFIDMDGVEHFDMAVEQAVGEFVQALLHAGDPAVLWVDNQEFRAAVGRNKLGADLSERMNAAYQNLAGVTPPVDKAAA